MKTRHRTESLITGGEMEPLFTLKSFPAYMMADGEKPDESFADMKFEIGCSDGFVQLADIIPPETLYKDTHSNAIGGVWDGMHTAVAEEVNRCSDRTTRILEIGETVRKPEMM